MWSLGQIVTATRSIICETVKHLNFKQMKEYFDINKREYKHSFKLRYDCLSDILEFEELLPAPCAMSRTKFRDIPTGGEVEIQTNLSLNKVMNLIRLIPDGHVMLQTIQPIELYTGERNYEIQ